MKNLITIITVLVFAITVNAQTQTTNPYAQLQSGFNFPQNGGNNQIAAKYASTGVLPNGYTTKTAQQICQEQNAVNMWVKYDVAADVNKEINGGHIAHPNEIFIITPQGYVHSAAKCGNHVRAIKFYKKPIVTRPEVTRTLDLTKVYRGQNQNRQLIEGNTKRLKRIETNQDVIVDNQHAISARVDQSLLNQATMTGMLEEIRDSSARTEKYSRQSRNWSIAGAVLGGIAATSSTIDLFNGDGNTHQVIRNIRNITNVTNTTGGSTGGLGHNGSK